VRTRISLLIPAVALAAALAACGDSGPSKATFMTKADAACAPGNNTISTTAKPTNAPQVGTSAGTAATTIDGQVGMLRAMKAPGGAKSEIQAVVNAIAAVGAPTKALQDAAGKTDDAAMAKAAVEMQAKADTAAKSAQDYGLTQCGTLLKPGLGNLFDGVKNVVKASYVVKAENLCRDSYRKIDALAQPGNSAASLVKYLDTILTLSTKLATDLKAVPAPPGDEGTVGEFLTAMDTLNAKVKDVSAAAKANNARLVGGLLDELNVAGTAVDAKLDAYGLTTCGSKGA
jgi:predicted small lipoprotein YifL